MTEGAAAAFTVSLDKPAAEALTAGERNATLKLATANDSVVEPASTVTATIAAGSGYSAGVPASAVVVEDDDAARFTVSAGQATIEQGGSTAVTVAIANGVTFAANDTPLSDDTTLSALTLSGIEIGTFDAATTDYAADVGNEVESTTVTATPNDDGAAVVITDAQGSTAGSTRTTQLDEGANAIGVAVTAADSIAARRYAVTVTRAAAARSPAWGERRPEKDIELSAADRPRGLWSDGETLWAADYAGGVYAYRLADGERLADDDLDAGAMAEAGNDRPAGLWLTAPRRRSAGWPGGRGRPRRPGRQHPRRTRRG